MNQHQRPPLLPAAQRGGKKSRQSDWFAAAQLAAQKLKDASRHLRPRSREPKSRQAAILDLVGGREVITTILLTIASGGTLMLTYFGVSVPMTEMGGGISQKGQALSFALTMGVLSWLGWFYLFGIIHWLRGKFLAIGVAAGFIYVGTVAAVDAPFIMLAIAGGSATQMSLVDTAASYEGRIHSMGARAGKVRQLIPGIRAQESRFAQLEANELQTGAHSGKKGAGKVSGGFGQIAILLKQLANQLNAGVAQVDEVQSEIAASIAKIKTEAYAHGPIRPRMQRASAEADRLDGLLTQLTQLDATSSIRATLQSLENIFPVPTGGKAGFEATQNAELAGIAAMAVPVAQALRAALNELPTEDVEVGRATRPIDPQEAIKIYWRPLLPHWIAAAFVDIAPALLIIILIVARREAERADPLGEGEKS